MRFLHTSDWHLGKKLFKLDRSEEHVLFLEWLLGTLIEDHIDVLLISGDIFDIPNPPHQSLELFYKFLHRVSTETNCDTYIISGNHDSGILLEAPAALLKTHRVKVWGKLSSNISDHWIEIKKNQETVELCGLPFFRTYELLKNNQTDTIEALKNYLLKEKKTSQLLMLHHLAGIFEAAGSEHVIGLSGIDSIPLEIIKHFDYVALGHIHKPQKIGANSYYAGSPIPLRFSETKEKSVVIITVENKETNLELKKIPLTRPLVNLKLDEDDWRKKIEQLEKNSPLEPIVEVQIKLKSPKPGIIDEIREALVKKNHELLSFIPLYQSEEENEKINPKLFELSPIEIFEEFYKTKYPENEEIPKELSEEFSRLLDKAKHATYTSEN